MKLDIIQADDEMFGNKQYTTINNITFIGRPRQFYGVHALVEHDDKIYLCAEDDGHFWNVKDLSIEEIEKLRNVLLKINDRFYFDGYKTIYNTKEVRKSYGVSKDINITIDKSSKDNPMVTIHFGRFHNCNLKFSAYWLGDLIKVLDIN